MGNALWQRWVRGIAAVLALGMLAACAPQEPVATPTPTPTATPAPAMELAEAGAYEVPFLTGFPAAANQALREYFSQIAADLASAEPEAELRYAFSGGAGAYRLTATVRYGGRDVLELPEVLVDREGGCTFRERPRWVEDTAYVRAALRLSELGLETDTARYGGSAYPEDWLEMMLGLYEGSCAEPPQYGHLPELEGGETYAHAISLRIADSGPEFYEQRTAYAFSMVSSVVAGTVSRIQKDVYGRYSQPVRRGDVTKMTRFFLETYQPANPGESAVSLADETRASGGAAPEETSLRERWREALAKLDVAELVGAATGEEAGVVDRLALARAFLAIHDALLGAEHQPPEGLWLELRDCDEEAAQRAVAYGFMSAYPGADLAFSPEQEVRYCDLPQLVSTFALKLYAYWCEEEGVKRDKVFAMEDLTIAAAGILDLFAGGEPFTEAIEVVNNGRKYDWYWNQYDTGAFSAVNCMPTITCMAMKWLDRDTERTPEELRGLYPELEAGWWLENVEGALDRYGVRYQRREVSLENLLADLQAGKILLVQMSEADPSQEGHCMVVYGYRRFGESLEFFTYDPALEEQATYEDRVCGNARMLEGNYCLFIVERFSSAYLNVPEQRAGEDAQREAA